MLADAKTDLCELIGNTPVFELRDPLVGEGRRLFLKLESFNPNFSVKDRTALGLIQAAVASGALLPGGTIIESTSGNLGKSLAMLGASMGFRVIVVVDPKVTPTMLNWYRAYGAEVDMVSVPDAGGSFQRARIARVQELVRQTPGAYWPNQYDNPENRNGHAALTGPEVLRDATAAGADTIVGCVSTGGHLCGIGAHIRHAAPDLRIVAGDVIGSAVFAGSFQPYLINGLGLGWRADNTRSEVIDGIVMGSDRQAISLCRLIARDHGLLLGGSSGIVLLAALAALHGGGARRVLAIIPDSGVSYLDQIYDDEWLRQKGIALLDRAALAADIAGIAIRPVEGPQGDPFLLAAE